MGLSKNKIKFIRKLEKKKYRYENHVFVAEGIKIIRDLLQSNLRIIEIIGLENVINGLSVPDKVPVTIAGQEDMDKISFQSTPQGIMAIVEMPRWQVRPTDTKNNFLLMLDGVQDPGNLGTIIRVADWFGIRAVVCSHDTVDVYNPKTVQSAMGSVFRMPVIYTDIESFLAQVNSPIYGTFMQGKPINEISFGQGGVIIMGNEAHGIRASVEKLITEKITIPRYHSGPGPESLNVAMATGIVLWEVRRN